MREIPNKSHAMNLSHEVIVNTSLKYAYSYIIDKLSNKYRKLAKGHDYFRILNKKKIEEGAIIECSESAGNQSIKHKYIVTEVFENERISFESKPSTVTIKFPGKTMESKSNTYVYYDYENAVNNQVKIRLTIIIQFSNTIEKLLGLITGGMIPWKKHCVEEMEGLRDQILENEGR